MAASSNLVGREKALAQKEAAVAIWNSMAMARFHAAEMSAENFKSWKNADSLGPDVAANPSVRQIVRDRARYEEANNCHARHLVDILANYAIGTGPSLQMLLPDKKAGEPNPLNASIEEIWDRWQAEIHLSSKLRMEVKTKAVTGDAFGVLSTNPKLRSKVKLDVVPIEADRVTTPETVVQPTPQLVDGIVFDEYGNPEYYHVLVHHPGEGYADMKYDTVPASQMIHWFTPSRPGQRRGLPDIMPALPLFALLRRYSLAVITAAEAVAELAIIMKTTLPTTEGETATAAKIPPFETMYVDRGMMTFAPDGWEPYQIKAEQPSTTYAEFKKEVLKEIGACMSVPENIITCSSAAYSYASGRMDDQAFRWLLSVMQSTLEEFVLDRIFDAFMEEACVVYPWLAPGDFPHMWYWDMGEHVDPVKEAEAQSIRLANRTTTRAFECARRRQDWRSVLTQLALEETTMRNLNLEVASTNAAKKGSAPQAKED